VWVVNLFAGVDFEEAIARSAQPPANERTGDATGQMQNANDKPEARLDEGKHLHDKRNHRSINDG